MTTLPVIDVSGLTSAELRERVAVAAALGRACRETGFFYIVKHGIPEAVRDAIFAAAQAFFSLPVAMKEDYSIKRSRHNRGYVALEGERLDEGASLSDCKEAFNVGLELAADDPEILAGKPFRAAGRPGSSLGLSATRRTSWRGWRRAIALTGSASDTSSSFDATGKTAEEMLAILERRLQNDASGELAIAAEEQRRITRLRLEKLLAAEAG